MVTLLIYSAFYLVLGLLSLALILRGPEKHESYIDYTHAIFIVLVWPTVGAWYVLSNMESPHFRNPYWTGGWG